MILDPDSLLGSQIFARNFFYDRLCVFQVKVKHILVYCNINFDPTGFKVEVKGAVKK